MGNPSKFGTDCVCACMSALLHILVRDFESLRGCILDAPAQSTIGFQLWLCLCACMRDFESANMSYSIFLL